MVNCGYTSIPALVPTLLLNQTAHLRSSQDMPGLPTEFVIPLNDTNGIRIDIGPVGEEFIGMTTIGCRFESLTGTVYSTTAILTIVG